MASSSSQPRSMKYDVFLSFRGEDTRNGIVSHIYKELKQRRLDPFLDEPEIRTGHAISDELVNAINQSRASIVVISKNYASSSWVLDELLEILECNENNIQMVLPIFYQVDPSDVRKQTGSFGKALEEHEIKFRKGKDTLELARNIEKIQDWKKALTKIASIKGYDSRDRSESDLVEEICADIWKKLHSSLQYDSDDLVGMDSHMAKMDNLLELSSNEVRMVGILGMGGIGKTTIATTVYEKIKKDFDMHCIVDDVKKLYKERKSSGLQKLLLSKLFKVKEAEMEIEGVTSNVVKEKLYRKKVLIVLDDLDHLEQLRACAKDPSWFGPCSRIIITTRDAQILTANRVEHVYEVGCLGDAEALHLFNLFAFKQIVIPNGFKDLSNRAVKLAHGLPLALKVLGSHLYCGSESYWESQLRKLERFPHRDIKEVLKTSYDSLDADTQDIFLYAACSLYPYGNNYEVTDACGYDTKSEINILVQKSLISLGRTNGTFVMHDLVQQMGRSIACGEPRRRPGKYKMLWDSEDILQVLSDNSGTKTIEGISLYFPYDIGCHVSPEAFKGMSNLKFLIFKLFGDDRLIFPKGLDWLPRTLNYLSWSQYPLPTLPVSFLPTNLVELYMTNSHLEKLWDGIKPLGKLKKMDLSYSKHLKILPDLSNATSLESLNLRDCQSLVELPALPPNLQFLNLKHCSKLTVVGSGKHLGKLKDMVLSYCEQLKILPDLSNATSLVKLNLSNCKNLVELSSLPPNLQHLDLSDCSALRVVNSRWLMVKLEKMLLSCCERLERIPNLSNATSLEKLSLSCCESLVEISALPQNLQILDLYDCSKLQVIDTKEPMKKLKTMRLSSCKQLKVMPDLSNATSLVDLDLYSCKSLVELSTLPPNLERLHLVKCSELKIVNNRWPLVKLNEMRLSGCGHLTSMPDLSNAISLVELDLCWCESLVELSGLPPNLEQLYLEGCSSLKVLDSKGPSVKLNRMPNLSNATHIEQLNLINCKSLVAFPKLSYKARICLSNLMLDSRLLPDNLSGFSSVRTLKVIDIGLEELPFSIMCLRHLKYLHLNGREDNVSDGIGWCFPSLSALCNLYSLRLINLNIQKILDDLDQLHQLEILDLSGNSFEALPVSIEKLATLCWLTLKNCRRLKALPKLPQRSLRKLCANGCTSLEQIHIDSLPEGSQFMDCLKLEKLENFAQLIVESMIGFPTMQTMQPICLSGSEILEWFGPQSSGICRIPHSVHGTNTIGFLSCILLPSESLKTFRQPKIKCDYRLILESEGRDFRCGTLKSNMFLSIDNNGDIPQRDNLLFWRGRFWIDIFHARDKFEGDSYDQVIFNFSIVDRVIGDSSTPSWKAERFGVRLLFPNY